MIQAFIQTKNCCTQKGKKGNESANRLAGTDRNLSAFRSSGRTCGIATPITSLPQFLLNEGGRAERDPVFLQLGFLGCTRTAQADLFRSGAIHRVIGGYRHRLRPESASPSASSSLSAPADNLRSPYCQSSVDLLIVNLPTPHSGARALA